MLPLYSLNNGPHVGGVNAVSSRNGCRLLAGFSATPNLNNVRLAKSRKRVGPTLIAPEFGVAIGQVLGLRSGKQMLGVYTRRVVAFVADEVTSWNVPPEPRPRQPMSGNYAPPEVEASVSVSLRGPDPVPAFSYVGLRDMRPESAKVAVCGIDGFVGDRKADGRFFHTDSMTEFSEGRSVATGGLCVSMIPSPTRLARDEIRGMQVPKI